MVNELYHYGVKGMKWGVRRYQDYDGKLTPLGKQRYSEFARNRRVQKLIENGRYKTENLSHYTVGELTTFTTPVGEKYVSGLISGHDFDWQETTLYNETGNEQDSYYRTPAEQIKMHPGAHQFTDLPTLRAHHEYKYTDADLKECNPDFGSPGTTQNCAKASMAMELRLRNYGISAGRQTYPSSTDAPSLWFKGAKRIDASVKDTEKLLKRYGKKTSGCLSFRYDNGSGHMVHWTNDSKGKFQIQDGQNGRVFDSISEMLSVYGGSTTLDIASFRLDNCQPDYDMMAQDSVIRRSWNNSYVINKNSGRRVDTW